MVSCQKGPTPHAYAWQIGPFWQDTLDIFSCCLVACFTDDIFIIFPGELVLNHSSSDGQVLYETNP